MCYKQRLKLNKKQQYPTFVKGTAVFRFEILLSDSPSPKYSKGT
jgi:hypothetical protein